MLLYIFKRILIRFLIFLIFLVFMFFLTCGFPYCKKLPFTEDELKWSAPYAVGDTIMFEGMQSKSIDTLIIKDKSVLNPSNTFIFDTEGCKWMESDHEFNAITSYTLIVVHDDSKYNCITSLRKVCNKKPLMFKTYFMERLSDSIYIQEIRDNRAVEFDNIEDIVIRDSDFTEEIDPDSIVLREIYWNRDRGLTGYKIGEEVYVLKENTND